MACCLLCFDDSPIEGDPKANREGTFQVSMIDAVWYAQPTCCCAYLFPCCCAYYIRSRTLDHDLSRYSCCQGYLDNYFFRAGNCGEKSCPEFCLCVESFCCLGPAMSSSRLFVMDQYNLRPDPCDNRLIRFTNCLMMLSCVCDILSLFIRELRDLARCLDYTASCVFYSTLGCMAGQVSKELDHRKASLQSYAELDNTTTPILGTARIIDDKKADL